MKGLLKRDRENHRQHSLTQDTHITVGILAQGVYEFHEDPLMLYRRDAVKKVAEILH